MAYDQNDPGDGGGDPSVNWWEQPRPSYVPANQPWPPPLSPGDSYGPNPGQVIKATGTPNNLFPPTTDVVPGVDLPLANPVAPPGGTGGGPSPTGGGGGIPTGNFEDPGFQFPHFVPPEVPTIPNAPTYTPPGAYVPPEPLAPPTFSAPPAFSYDPFSYGDFQQPTLDEAKNAPGYQFAADEGRRALETGQAARGLLRTGGSLKDLFSWGDRFAEQNYGNVFNRDLQTYGTNRGNAFDNWSANRENAADAYRTNYGISKDVFDTNYGNTRDAYGINAGLGKDAYTINRDTGLSAFDRNADAAKYDRQSILDTFDRLFQNETAKFNPDFEAAKLKFTDMYNRWRDILNSTTTLAGGNY